MDIKLQMAIVIRKLQEDLKTSFSNMKNRMGSNLTSNTSNELEIDLRLINFAMRMTASQHHGYDDAQFRSKGTTPTHLIYSKISKFDFFLQTVIQIALTPNVQV